MRSAVAICALALALLTALTTKLAWAGEAPSTVALVRTPPGDKLLREASVRLRAELTDAGFAVVEIDRAPEGDSRSSVEETSAAGSSFATVAINRAGPSALADVWISDHVTGKTVVRRLEVDNSTNAANVLAIRALELLRASLLEVAAKQPAEVAPRPPPSDVLKWIEPVLPAREPVKDLLRGGAAIEIGAIALHGLRGVGLGGGPAAHVSLGITGPWFARLTLAGPLLGPAVHASAGSASVRQAFGSMDLGWASRAEPIGAFAWAGAGVFDFHVSGSAIAPYRSTSDDVVSFVATAGVGGLARLGPSLGVTATVAALALDPEPAVAIAGVDAGRAGAPSLAFTLGLVVGL
jgi:hypothetical protein